MTSLRSRSRAPLAALSLVLVAVCAGASTAGAPVAVADGVAACSWLKLKAKASSFEVEADDAGLGPKRGPSATCLQLLFAARAANPHGVYGGRSWYGRLRDLADVQRRTKASPARRSATGTCSASGTS
jgi:hypothetical protein